MAELNVEINGNASGLNNAINQSTANLNAFSRTGVRSIQSLQIQLQSFQRIAARATDPAVLSDYNRRIETTRSEITRLTNVGRTGFDSMGNAISRSTGTLSSSYGLLRTVANILPGIGIAGAIGFAVGPLIDYVKNLEIIKGTAQDVATELAFESTDYTKALTEVTSLKSSITDFHDGLITGKQLVDEYNKGIGQTAGELKNVTQVEDFYNSKSGNYVQAMLLRARANVALETAVKNVGEAEKRAASSNTFLDYLKASGDALTGILTFRGNISKNFKDALATFKNRDADELYKSANASLKVFEQLKRESESFNKTNNITLDADKTKSSTKSIADIYDTLNKSLERTYVQHESTFGKQLQQQLSAYQAAIDAATDAYGRQSKEVQKLQKEQAKLVSGVNYNLNSGRKSNVTAAGPAPLAPGLVSAASDRPVNFNDGGQVGEALSRELEWAIKSFGRDFTDILSNINNRADATFGSIFSDIASSITNVFQDVFMKQLTEALIESINRAKQSTKNSDGSGDDDNDSAKIAAALGVAGALVSGSTKKTSAAGQTLGGALSGAAVGTAILPGIGTVLGGLIGGLGGFFGSKKAKKQEELQKKQLEEAEKQTKLLERQNALAYTSSIIGRQTTSGIVTGVEINESGELIARLSGQNIDLILRRTTKSKKRGL